MTKELFYENFDIEYFMLDINGCDWTIYQCNLDGKEDCYILYNDTEDNYIYVGEFEDSNDLHDICIGWDAIRKLKLK